MLEASSPAYISQGACLLAMGSGYIRYVHADCFRCLPTVPKQICKTEYFTVVQSGQKAEEWPPKSDRTNYCSTYLASLRKLNTV